MLFLATFETHIKNILMVRDAENLLQLSPKVLFQCRTKRSCQRAEKFCPSSIFCRADNTLFWSIGHVRMLKNSPRSKRVHWKEITKWFENNLWNTGALIGDLIDLLHLHERPNLWAKLEGCSFLPAYPRAFGGIAPWKSSNRDQKWLLPHQNAKYHVEFIVCISLYFTGEQNWPTIAQWNQITLHHSNSREGWIFCGPQNSITTTLHYGKCQWAVNRLPCASRLFVTAVRRCVRFLLVSLC